MLSESEIQKVKMKWYLTHLNHPPLSESHDPASLLLILKNSNEGKGIMAEIGG